MSDLESWCFTWEIQIEYVWLPVSVDAHSWDVPFAPDPSPHTLTPTSPQALSYQISGHMYVVSMSGRDVGRHLLLYVPRSLLFCLEGEGEWFPS